MPSVAEERRDDESGTQIDDRCVDTSSLAGRDDDRALSRKHEIGVRGLHRTTTTADDMPPIVATGAQNLSRRPDRGDGDRRDATGRSSTRREPWETCRRAAGRKPTRPA